VDLGVVIEVNKDVAPLIVDFEPAKHWRKGEQPPGAKLGKTCRASRDSASRKYRHEYLDAALEWLGLHDVDRDVSFWKQLVFLA
jgi:hypothetical protein